MADNIRSDNGLEENITSKEIIDKLFKQLDEANKLNYYTVRTMENMNNTNRKILTEQAERSKNQNAFILIVSSLILTIVLCTSIICYFGFDYGWNKNIKVTNESKSINEFHNKNINENENENDNNNNR